MSRQVFQPTPAGAVALDAHDPLAGYRDQFHLPQTADGSACLYLCGHSLGLQPKTVRSYVEQELQVVIARGSRPRSIA